MQAWVSVAAPAPGTGVSSVSLRSLLRGAEDSRSGANETLTRGVPAQLEGVSPHIPLPAGPRRVSLASVSSPQRTSHRRFWPSAAGARAPAGSLLGSAEWTGVWGCGAPPPRRLRAPDLRGRGLTRLLSLLRNARGRASGSGGFVPEALLRGFCPQCSLSQLVHVARVGWKRSSRLHVSKTEVFVLVSGLTGHRPPCRFLQLF